MKLRCSIRKSDGRLLVEIALPSYIADADRAWFDSFINRLRELQGRWLSEKLWSFPPLKEQKVRELLREWADWVDPDVINNPTVQMASYGNFGELDLDVPYGIYG